MSGIGENYRFYDVAPLILFDKRHILSLKTFEFLGTINTVEFLIVTKKFLVKT